MKTTQYTAPKLKIVIWAIGALIAVTALAALTLFIIKIVHPQKTGVPTAQQQQTAASNKSPAAAWSDAQKAVNTGNVDDAILQYTIARNGYTTAGETAKAKMMDDQITQLRQIKKQQDATPSQNFTDTSLNP